MNDQTVREMAPVASANGKRLDKDFVKRETEVARKATEETKNQEKPTE